MLSTGWITVVASRASTRPAGATGAVTHFADAGQMRAWLASAPPGQLMIYACGPNLFPGSNPAAVLAREWQAGGLAELSQTRADRDGCWNYRARKLAEIPSVDLKAPLAGSTNQDPPEFSDSEEGRLYRLIKRTALAGLPCPSNAEIAEALELDSRFRARDRFNALVKAGHLNLIEGNRFGARVVEVAATGARTAVPGASKT